MNSYIDFYRRIDRSVKRGSTFTTPGSVSLLRLMPAGYTENRAENCWLSQVCSLSLIQSVASAATDRASMYTSILAFTTDGILDFFFNYRKSFIEFSNEFAYTRTFCSTN